MKILEDVKNYIPRNEQETIDRLAMLSFFEKNDDYLDRANLVAHATSSAIVMNESLTKILFAYHKIYDSWAWVGGHNDGDDDCLNVAIKEAKEETGIKNVSPLSKDIAGIDIIYVNSHTKNGKYIGDHLHLNLTYILIADETDELVINKDENTGVKWFTLEELFDNVSEERMKGIYSKLIEYALQYKEVK